jgi:hypothetical protein
VTLDPRTLDSDGWAREMRARRGWKPDRVPVVAHHLAELASEYLNQYSEPAVRAFAHRAGAPGRRVAFAPTGSPTTAGSA